MSANRRHKYIFALMWLLLCVNVCVCVCALVCLNMSMWLHLCFIVSSLLCLLVNLCPCTRGMRTMRVSASSYFCINVLSRMHAFKLLRLFMSLNFQRWLIIASNEVFRQVQIDLELVLGFTRLNKLNRSLELFLLSSAETATWLKPRIIKVLFNGIVNSSSGAHLSNQKLLQTFCGGGTSLGSDSKV